MSLVSITASFSKLRESHFRSGRLAVTIAEVYAELYEVPEFTLMEEALPTENESQAVISKLPVPI